MKAPTTDISATPFSETMPQDSLRGVAAGGWIMGWVETVR